MRRVVPVVDTTIDEPLGLGYEALRHRELELGESSVPISPSSPVVPSPIASPVTTPAATISVDEDQFLEGYDKDLRELYTRSAVVRDEIFLQRYSFRSLEREHERATVTFSVIWRPILALEAWAGQTDAQRTALWHAIYDIQRENHDLKRKFSRVPQKSSRNAYEHDS
uniref:Uncharacterized protein n=1 Tax=Tanacetum cinerariifolium TaxID=118510 RepID=A0A6L2NJ50_TANCI|nr:hypothetical protein [Tanacetum cinerariifolium]